MFHRDSEYVSRLDDALDEADVDLATALARPDHALRNTVLVAGHLDPYDRAFAAELWTGTSLLEATVDLHGDVFDVDDFGWNQRAEWDAGVITASELSLYDAIAVGEDEIAFGRAFSASVDDPWYEVDLLADFRIYRLWISPRDGGVVDIVIEHDGWRPHCPCG